MLTSNEKKVLRLLLASYDTDYSINGIAKECGLSPNGAYKILSKYEKEGILIPKKIANIKSYRLNFQNEKTDSVLELSLISDHEKRISHRIEDLKNLKDFSKACIFFGSYTYKKDPHDLDVLFVLESSDYKRYSEEIKKAKDIIPIEVHDVVQTPKDFKENIRRKDKVILSILREGVVAWGHNLILEVVKDAYR
jgi:DNA-binding Lrp family transcriptional regulator